MAEKIDAMLQASEYDSALFPHLQRLIALHRGELLAEEDGVAWIDAERRRVRDRFHHLLRKAENALRHHGHREQADCLKPYLTPTR